MWVPVAVWQPCELLYTCYLLTYTSTELHVFDTHWLRHSTWRRGYYPHSGLAYSHVEVGDAVFFSTHLDFHGGISFPCFPVLLSSLRSLPPLCFFHVFMFCGLFVWLCFWVTFYWSIQLFNKLTYLLTTGPLRSSPPSLLSLQVGPHLPPSPWK